LLPKFELAQTDQLSYPEFCQALLLQSGVCVTLSQIDFSKTGAPSSAHELIAFHQCASAVGSIAGKTTP
jgi:hypothetical protein